jgi:MoxR-like ATPase
MAKSMKIEERLAAVFDLMDRRLVHRVLLYGPPGTGKSTSPHYYAPSRKTYRVTCTPSAPAESLLGNYELSSVNGATATHFVPGPLPRAMTEGAILVLDEIDLVSPELEAVVPQALDDFAHCSIILPTGETIRPIPGYCVIATTNADPSTLPARMIDRFDVILLVSTPPSQSCRALGHIGLAVENYYSTIKTPVFSRTLSHRSAIRIKALVDSNFPLEASIDFVLGGSPGLKEALAALSTVKEVGTK